MKVTKQFPEKEYPYLATWANGNKYLSDRLISSLEVKDIVLISMVEVEDKDNQVYVQQILGGKQAYITKNEDEYCPLPKGYRLILEQ